MNRMDKEKLSPCEEIIMKIIWDSKEAIATPDIIDKVKIKYGKEYARTTVVTFLNRLCGKGFIKTYRKGRLSYAVAIRQEEQYKQKLIEQICGFWFHDKPSELMELLFSIKKPSSNEVKKIRCLLDELKEKNNTIS